MNSTPHSRFCANVAVTKQTEEELMKDEAGNYDACQKRCYCCDNEF